MVRFCPRSPFPSNRCHTPEVACPRLHGPHASVFPCPCSGMAGPLPLWPLPHPPAHLPIPFRCLSVPPIPSPPIRPHPSPLTFTFTLPLTLARPHSPTLSCAPPLTPHISTSPPTLQPPLLFLHHQHIPLRLRRVRDPRRVPLLLPLRPCRQHRRGARGVPPEPVHGAYRHRLHLGQRFGSDLGRAHAPL